MAELAPVTAKYIHLGVADRYTGGSGMIVVTSYDSFGNPAVTTGLQFNGTKNTTKVPLTNLNYQIGADNITFVNGRTLPVNVNAPANKNGLVDGMTYSAQDPNDNDRTVQKGLQIGGCLAKHFFARCSFFV